MKKIILALCISMLFSVWTQAGELIEMNKCTTYYDGCNTCSVFNGEIGACTEMYCMEKWTPKCIKEIEEPKKITNAQDLCEVSNGTFNQENCEFWEKTIKASTLYSLYMDFTGQMMYMWGSKYFDERIGSNNLGLVQSDYHSYLFIKKNISQLYKQYPKEIDAKIKFLSSKLNISTTLENKYELLLGKTNLRKINKISDKLVGRTVWMSHIEKERYLIKKVQLLENLRNKYSDKNTNWKYSKVLNILDYLYQKIERNIAYE
jgi:hypothetical protein